MRSKSLMYGKTERASTKGSWWEVPSEALYVTVPLHKHNDARTRKRPPPCGSGTAAARARQTINPAKILMTKALKNFTWWRREVGRHVRTERELGEDWLVQVRLELRLGPTRVITPFPSSLPVPQTSHPIPTAKLPLPFTLARVPTNIIHDGTRLMLIEFLWTNAHVYELLKHERGISLSSFWESKEILWKKQHLFCLQYTAQFRIHLDINYLVFASGKWCWCFGIIFRITKNKCF